MLSSRLLGLYRRMDAMNVLCYVVGRTKRDATENVLKKFIEIEFYFSKFYQIIFLQIQIFQILHVMTKNKIVNEKKN